jgi:hypothetical protein
MSSIKILSLQVMGFEDGGAAAAALLVARGDVSRALVALS